MTRFRLRRGGVLPFVCIMLTVLLGAAAMAVDMGRLYATASEAQAAADAAALAAASASQLTPNTDSQNGPLRAQQNAARNRVAGQAATVATADVVPFLYDPATNASTTSSYFGTVNAVQVAVRAQARYALAGAIGLAPPTVTRRGTAWIGNMVGAACMRPVAPPYTRIYEDANGLTSNPYSAHGQYAPSLTQVQVAAYSPNNGSTPVSRTFVLLPPWFTVMGNPDTVSRPNSGMWHSVDYRSLGYSQYVTNISASVGSASCATASTAVGQYLNPFVFNGTAGNSSYYGSTILPYTQQGFVQLCNRAGNGSSGSAWCRNADNTVGVKVRMPLSDSIPAPGGTFTQRVRMVTQLRVMCYFANSADVCANTAVSDGAGNQVQWQMPSPSSGGGPVVTGYPPGTIVVLLDGPLFMDLTPDVVLGDTISYSQRLVLVK